MRKIQYSSIIIALLSIIITNLFYPNLPAKIAAHWNTAGIVDGYLPKSIGSFLIPGFTLFIVLLCIFLQKKDTLTTEKNNIYLDSIILTLSLFFMYVQLLILFWNTYQPFNMTYYLIPGIILLMYACGHVIEHVSRNEIAGYRLSWTLKNEKIWKKTNVLGGRLFKIISILGIFSFFVHNGLIFLFAIPVFLSVIGTIVYSYVLSRKDA